MPEEKVCTFCVNRGAWGYPPGKKELLVLNGTNLCYLEKKNKGVNLELPGQGG